MFFVFVLELYLEYSGIYHSQISAQQSLLVVLKMLGIELGSTVCKASALPIVLSFLPPLPFLRQGCQDPLWIFKIDAESTQRMV